LAIWCEEPPDVRCIRGSGHLVEHYRSQGSFRVSALTYPQVVLVVGPQVTTVRTAGVQVPRGGGRYSLLNDTSANVVRPGGRTMVHMRQVQGLVGNHDGVVWRVAQQLQCDE
jgi:hypothetical protein